MHWGGAVTRSAIDPQKQMLSHDPLIDKSWLCTARYLVAYWVAATIALRLLLAPSRCCSPCPCGKLMITPNYAERVCSSNATQCLSSLPDDEKLTMHMAVHK
eukprot:4879232-Amphidinium_carterae.1